MCGIFGWNLQQHRGGKGLSRSKRIALAIGLSLGNDKRGGDSWGIFHPDKAERSQIVKGLGQASPNWSKIALPNNGLIGQRLIGHTRFGTHGAKDDLNCAHPFRIGRIVGVHNGVIGNHEELNTLYDRNFEVDSQHLLCHLAEDLGGDDWGNIHGYGTVCWWDPTAEDRIYFLKFNGGELAVASLADGGLVWSSDKKHLTGALDLAGIETETTYRTTEKMVHYVDESGYWVTKKEIALGERHNTKSWKSQGCNSASRMNNLVTGPGSAKTNLDSKRQRRRRRKERRAQHMLRQKQIQEKGYVTIVDGRVETTSVFDKWTEETQNAAALLLELRWLITLTDDQLHNWGYRGMRHEDITEELAMQEALWPKLENLTGAELGDIVDGVSTSVELELLVEDFDEVETNDSLIQA